MTSPFTLIPEDREILDEMVQEIADSLDNVGASQLGIPIYTQCRREDEAGNDWAGRVIQTMAAYGFTNYAKRFLKNDRANIRIARTGQVLNIPTRFGQRMRSETGISERRFQMPLWWELSWEEFEGLIVSLQSQLATIGLRITALKEVRELREQFPESRTPLEACEAKGIDPRSFKIDVA